MRVLEGKVADLHFDKDASLITINSHCLRVDGLTINDTTVSYDLSNVDGFIYVNGEKTSHKTSSIRVYRVWDSVTHKFLEPVPEHTSYCISIGILQNTQKMYFKDIVI